MGETPEVKGMIVVDGWVDESVLGAWHFVTPEEVISAVRAGVESGTIKGEVVGVRKERNDNLAPNAIYGVLPGEYLLIPVSDGGSET